MKLAMSVAIRYWKRWLLIIAAVTVMTIIDTALGFDPVGPAIGILVAIMLALMFMDLKTDIEIPFY